jgi:hypothetical protein
VPLFRVRLNGIGFRKVVDGSEGRYSFYANQFVEAETPQLAADKALDALAARPDLREQLVQGGPTVVIESVVEHSGERPGQQGLAWYADPAN